MYNILYVYMYICISYYILYVIYSLNLNAIFLATTLSFAFLILMKLSTEIILGQKLIRKKTASKIFLERLWIIKASVLDWYGCLMFFSVFRKCQDEYGQSRFVQKCFGLLGSLSITVWRILSVKGVPFENLFWKILRTWGLPSLL